MDTYNTLTPLHFFLKIFSLHNISYTKKGYVVNPWPFFKITIMLFIFGLLTSYNLFLHYTTKVLQSLSSSVVVVDTVDILLIYFEFIVDLWFVYKCGSDMCAYFNNYDQMDAVFKFKYNKKIKQSVMTMLATFLSSWLIASLGQYSVWLMTSGWLSPTTYAVSYITILIRFLTALDFISQTMHIRLHLKTITDHIEEFALFADDSVNRIKTVKKWGNRTGIQNTKVTPFVSKFRSEIAKTSSYYLLLIEQTKFLNRFFGVRTLMYCLYILAEMITFVNFVAKVISGTMKSVMTFYVLLVPNILRIINCVGILSCLIYHCELCCHECGNIIDVIDRLLINKKISKCDSCLIIYLFKCVGILSNLICHCERCCCYDCGGIIIAIDRLLVKKRNSEEINSSLKTLRKLVTSRPLKFTAAGFFSIESTLLLSIVSVVITYALILVQNTQ